MKVVFLDRDGTVIVDKEYLSDPDRVEFEPGVEEALRDLQAAGFGLIFVSNQSGIGRGLMTREQSQAVHQRTLDLLAARGITITGSYICPHTPWDRCECRKPSPLLLLQAAAEHQLDFSRSFIVGDKKSDIDTGRAAGCRTILYGTAEADPDYQSTNWSDIAHWIQAAPHL